ncbi:MAG: phage holin family protein, partial [Flavobacteriales bacterium]|nr:phage holin family protein [Flavobacteriales bacterium]
MNFLLRIIISSLAVLLTAYILPGIHVDTYVTALCVALVLAILNGIVKPILI